MYGRNVYGTTRWGSKRSYSLAQFIEWILGRTRGLVSYSKYFNKIIK